MNRTTGFILSALLAFGLAGCGTGPRIKYYTVRTPATPDPASDHQGVSLLVGRVTAPGILEDGPIAYRVGAHQIGTYQYHRWEDPPNDMLQLNLIRQLRDTGEYSSVSSLTSDSDGKFLLRGRLYDFEEVDGENITALVSMDFELVDRKTGGVLWSHFYSQSEPVEGKKVPEVVAALNRNLDRGLKEVSSGLGSYFSKPVAQR